MKSKKPLNRESAISYKIIAFDLDDVICTRPKKYEHLGLGKYKYCKPIKKMIKIVNQLYDTNMIKIYTSRGMTILNGNVSLVYAKLYTLTLKHLKQWGVKYDVLVMGKTQYDILIDDKVINSSKINKASYIKL